VLSEDTTKRVRKLSLGVIPESGARGAKNDASRQGGWLSKARGGGPERCARLASEKKRRGLGAEVREGTGMGQVSLLLCERKEGCQRGPVDKKKKQAVLSGTCPSKLNTD